MFGKTTMISLVSAMALVLPAVDAFATIGCYPAGVVTGLITDVTGETTTGVTSAANCAQRSRVLNRNYAYYSPATQTCYSVLLNPLVGGLNNAVGTLVGGTGTSVCGATQLQGLDVTTPYTDFGCAAPIDTQTANRDTFISIGGILSVANCLDDCADRGFPFAFVTNIAADLTCSCATNVNIVVPSLCGLGANFIYTNNLIAPSGIPARRRALEVKRNQKVGMCPSGLQACRVSAQFASDDFECVDVKAELESCGGCTAGIIDGDASLATSGVDCTALPGVEMGAVSCISGKCEISQCKRGYTLLDNTCTSTRSVASLALKALRLQNL